MASPAPKWAPERERTVMLVALTVVASALLGVTAMARRSARAQHEMGGLVTHTLEVREEVFSLRALLGDAERSQRYYLLSGNEGDLAGYYEAVGSMRPHLARLTELTRDNPLQQERISELTGVMEQRRARLDSVITVRRVLGLERARQLVVQGEGQLLGEAAARRLASIVQVEDSLLTTRRAAWDAFADRTQRIQIVALLLALTFVVVSYVLLARLAALRRKSQAERDRAFEVSLDMLCTADAAGRFVTLNPAWEKTLGYPLAEMLGRAFIEFVHPDDRETTLEQYRRQMEAGARAVNFVNRYRHQDGSYRVLSWNAVPDLAAGITYASARDITEIEEAHERQRRDAADLARALEQATAANRELEAFSYSVSHDLRAPLRHMDGFSNLLERQAGSALDDKARQYLDTIRQATGNMGRLIDGLLSFSKLGRAEMKVGSVRLHDLARTALKEVEAETTRRKVNVELRPLPLVRGDPSLLGAVFRNLVGNALKYTRGRDAAAITIGTEPARDGMAVVFVRDNGAGFDMKYASKLFGVFQRLHSADEFEGTGVGLATVQRIVHRHGGTVWAEGAVGEGATFYVALPQADVTEGGA